MIDDDENPLNAHKCALNESVLINKSFDNEFVSIAVAEDSVLITFSHDFLYEELSHPLIFPYEKFGF